MGERTTEALRVHFDTRVRLKFHGATLTSDAGLLACRELDDALGLTQAATRHLAEHRSGRNVQYPLVSLLRQSVYRRLADYEDINDAERLSGDPAMRAVTDRLVSAQQAWRKNMRNLFTASLVFLLIASLAPDLGATTMKRLTKQDLTEKAQLIVLGRAVETKSAWVDRRLVTLATISVGEVLKGDRPATVTVVLPGGVDANRKFPLAMMVPGAPQIHAQEEVFLFLKRANQHATGDAESYIIVGFSQGKLSIMTDASGNKMVAHHQVSAGTAGIVPLAQFKQEISGLLTSAGARQQP